ncbi:Peptidyl-tRNA hydrolase, chloroplastic [Morella rubra]|uniref:Peptidyl-tRNA hydrolase, chloroplastic n=1 Tax=Morella rubra TaxID=262757 RepID=A0A6A1VLA5_9ROSI|nr:Peptidyl-tRNA hydrolase, chloroplastic [Morella rubra]
MNFGASLSSTAIIRTPNLHRWSTLIPLPALSFFNWRTPRIVPLASGLSASMSTSSSSATEPATMEAQAPLAHRRPRKPRQELGFETVDAIAESEGISMSTVSFRALFGKGFIGDVPVLLAKPQTFMNASGESDFTFQHGLEAVRILLLEGFNKSATFVNSAKPLEQLG